MTCIASSFNLPISSHVLIEAFFLGIFVCLFHNLGLQVIFVRQNVALPFGYRLVFANPNLLCNLSKKNYNIFDCVLFLHHLKIT